MRANISIQRAGSWKLRDKSISRANCEAKRTSTLPGLRCTASGIVHESFRMRFLARLALSLVVWTPAVVAEKAADAAAPKPAQILAGLREFFSRTAGSDGSFANGLDPHYRGMSDSAYSDLAAVTYAVTLHKTFGWKLPHEEATRRFLLSRQQENGDFFNVAGTVDPKSAWPRSPSPWSSWSCSRRSRS